MNVSAHLRAFRQQLTAALADLYEPAEAEAIVRHLLEHLIGEPAHRWRGAPDWQLSPAQQATAQVAAARLLAGEPLQHITGWASFFGHDFAVSPAVLIPRQETEELVQWILDSLPTGGPLRLLDVGTGSGCIPVSLALALAAQGRPAEVTGLEVSPAALALARANGDRLGAAVDWQAGDLFALGPEAFAELDILVSNPPYIPLAERASLHPNVREHDPALALFVPDTDPLRYYRQLVSMAPHWLRPGGWLYVEIHASFGPEVVALCRAGGAGQVELRPDLSGRDRMVRAQWG